MNIKSTLLDITKQLNNINQEINDIKIELNKSPAQAAHDQAAHDQAAHDQAARADAAVTKAARYAKIKSDVEAAGADQDVRSIALTNAKKNSLYTSDTTLYKRVYL